MKTTHRRTVYQPTGLGEIRQPPLAGPDQLKGKAIRRHQKAVFRARARRIVEQWGFPRSVSLEERRRKIEHHLRRLEKNRKFCTCCYCRVKDKPTALPLLRAQGRFVSEAADLWIKEEPGLEDRALD